MPRSTFASRTIGAVAAFLLALGAAPASAQTGDSPPGRLALRISGGAFVATGGQRHQMKNAELTAAQFAWSLTPRLALNTTFAWARSRDVATTGAPRLDVFTTDVGAEFRLNRAVFAGLGAGARSYNYRKIEAPATHNVAAYASVGTEFGIRRVGIRLEARDYATGFRPLAGTGASVARNDVVVIAGVRVR